MRIFLLGLSHKTAPVKVRECLAPPAEELPGAVRGLAGIDGVDEAVLLSTCNRVEALCAARDPQAHQTVRDWLAHRSGLAAADLEPMVYLHHGPQAVRHIFRVACSLDSLVVGEPQILGQIKDAYRLAADQGCAGAVLNRLMHKAFQVAKRVRSETCIGGAAVSVSYAAVELAKKIFEDLAGLTVLLVGAGEMAELAAEHLKAQGVGRILVANRTLSRAVELAQVFGGAAHGLEELERLLASADIVISSTGATRPVITTEMAKKAMRARRGKPVFLIDIAVPRDIETEVGEIDGCFRYDIDDLTEVVQANRAARAQEAEVAEGMVATEVEKFMAWLEQLQAAPTIAALMHKAEELRQQELARSARDLASLDPQELAAVERLTQSLVKKLMHHPVLFLKNHTHPKSAQTEQSQLALLRRAFGLEEG